MYVPTYFVVCHCPAGFRQTQAKEIVVCIFCPNSKQQTPPQRVDEFDILVEIWATTQEG